MSDYKQKVKEEYAQIYGTLTDVSGDYDWEYILSEEEEKRWNFISTKLDEVEAKTRCESFRLFEEGHRYTVWLEGKDLYVSDNDNYVVLEPSKGKL